MLVALREHAPGGFGAADLKLLTVLASQTAVALENAELYQRLQREALVDGLTGILNYRSFIRALRSELRRALRYHETFAFVMADVDHLKTYNERFGHLAGSQVLVGVAQLLVGSCRGTDVVGKYGGDEFALILPQTDAAGARSVSDRMRLAIERHAFKHVRPGDVTCSFGVAVYPDDAHDAYGLIRQADGVLFAAKRAGKNRVLTTADLLETAITARAHPDPTPHAS
jgi:diguanylate cyclase (GGDEF)-like protein